MAIDLTKALRAALLAAYAATPACVAGACTDETATTAPLALRRRYGSAARAARKTPLTLTAMTSSHVASSMSATVP